MGNLQKVVYLTQAQAQELFTNGTITVGGVTVTYSADDLYVTPENGVVDVQVNGSSILNNGVANVPIASDSAFGAVKAYEYYGVKTIASGTDKGTLQIVGGTDAQTKEGVNQYRPVTIEKQHKSVFYGLAKCAGDSTQSSSANAVGIYTEDALSKISEMLNAPVSVSGSTPSITAKSGIRYVCGEVSTLSVTLPSSGDVEIIFESGSTATVLTFTPPSGVTEVKWAGSFDPTSLEANTVYDMIITDGKYGVCASWT